MSVTRQLGAASQPLVLAGERRLEVDPSLAPLLPGGGLRRGAAVQVTASEASGATTLALALLASASRAGSWCAVVGVPELGLVAAAQLGICLERLVLVARPHRQWAAVTAAVLDTFDAVVLRPPPATRESDARRLLARARERGSALVVLGSGWPQRCDLVLTVTGAVPGGLGEGHGHWQGRRVEVVVTGRGAAARRRGLGLWLPDREGRVAVAGPAGEGSGVVSMQAG